MRSYVSLGLSCQTRFSIDALFADPRRYPFDWIISTRSGLLEGLRSAGANFRQSMETVSVYTMPTAGHQGIRCGNMFFWHDNPIDRSGQLLPGWESALEACNEKYERRWSRLYKLLTDRTRDRRLICSNSQANLTEFADDERDFALNFGLDLEFGQMLRATLKDSGAEGCSVTFLNRSIQHSHTLACLGGAAPVLNRFWGPTALPTSALLASSSLLHRMGIDEACARLDLIEGEYSSAAVALVVRRVSDRIGYAYRVERGQLEPWAEISPLENGYLFVFDGGVSVNRHFTAAFDEGVLMFSNGASWRRS